ncbi:MAG TPA: dolichyl-phosphate beta-glucosyltransferase [Ktedonobacterales bacterium]|nr:dolichyl-phosphate beta-glucosyltransferase [Ktedonobacterales bacterium]
MEEASRPITLSIIIPAYNEARRLPVSLRQLRAWLDEQPYSAEVIVVDDGSSDDTADVVRAAMTGWSALSLLAATHAGKGAAVREGALAACGDWVAFADADFSMPVSELEQLRVVAAETSAVAIASREAPGARRYGEPWYRHVMGRVFNRLVQVLLLPGIQDTQCGFKCMPREIAVALCNQQTISGWGFDVELLAIARRHHFAIREVPIPWYYMANSRVRLARDTFNMVREVFTIRANLRNGRYNLTKSAAAPVAGQALEARNIHAH